ncbi:GNAT family N-acetyltransferase [Dactylosporangium sp. CA-092794]|uniref:GNAT family N-acetyltransferase n=1 Tax=Dactylosporangium sp. CA-092794 TaxID=3239929 RepID=UPI003D9469D5
MRLREFALDNLPEVDRIRSAVFPWHTADLETQRTLLRAQPPHARALRVCAELGGRVVGFGVAMLEVNAAEPGVGSVSVAVQPDFRMRGIGSAIHARLEGHLRGVGARHAQGYAMLEPPSLDWAERRGFTFGATVRYLSLDPRSLPPLSPAPANVVLLTAGEAGPAACYAVDNTASQDEPGDIRHAGMAHSEWLDRRWNVLDPEVSMVATVDGSPAALTMLDVNRVTGRAMSIGSGTLPAHRGLGLMRLLKSASLRRAAEFGVTTAFTANDETNKPMLAINEWLGYRYLAGIRSAIKDL